MKTLIPSQLISPVKKDNREVDIIPTAAFVATLVVIPIWACTVLPLSVTWQICKAVVGKVFPQDEWSYKDSGYKVEPSQRKPLNERTYDVVFLGVTGFTGGLAVRYMVQTYGVNPKSIKWAIAGRSQKKLDALKAKLASELNDEGINAIPTIIVDTSIPATMPRLVEDTRVVATTAGPYSLYGSSVIEFSAKFGTHYVDITGEVDWVKNMAAMYQERARETGSKIIPFTGHDCVPWDLMTMKLQDILDKECHDVMEKISFWDELMGGFAGGTLATVINAIEGKRPMAPKTKVNLFRSSPNGEESDYKVKKDLPTKPQKAESPWDPVQSSKRWTIPFIMAGVNADVISWSHALRKRGSKNLVYSEKWIVADFKTAFTMYAGMAMMIVSFLNPLTLGLAKQVMTKPGDGPLMEDMEKKHYLVLAGEGVGEKGNRIEAMFYLPKDPGCMETSRMMTESALCLALDGDGVSLPLPKVSGGFWSPSIALGEPLLQRLLKTGSTLDIQVVSQRG